MISYEEFKSLKDKKLVSLSDITEALRDGAMTKKELAERLGVCESTVMAKLWRLKRAGKVECKVKRWTNKGKEVYWGLVEQVSL